jgi:hypothetical protein
MTLKRNRQGMDSNVNVQLEPHGWPRNRYAMTLVNFVMMDHATMVFVSTALKVQNADMEDASVRLDTSKPRKISVADL